jgi:hypothetical protein
MIILIKLILLSVIVFQITQIITESTLFQPIRTHFYLLESETIFINEIYKFIYKLINCFLCASVWISFILLLILLQDFTVTFDLFEIRNVCLSIFLDTMLLSGVTWFWHCLENNWTK